VRAGRTAHERDGVAYAHVGRVESASAGIDVDVGEGEGAGAGAGADGKDD
jgi:hypothetical protein